MPPIHPDFVHFAIALVVVAFFADLVGFARHHASALTVGWTCLLLGLVGTLATILSGISDMNRAALHPDTHELVEVHMRLGLVLGVAIFALTIWRAWIAKAGPATRRAAPFLVCFAAVLALLSFQGWFGGELAYAHGAGVAATGQGMHPPAQARARLDQVARPLMKLPGLKPDEPEHAGDAPAHEP